MMSDSAPERALPAVAITALHLTDFRNYASLSIATDTAAVVLTGANGVGKTNLLEAISLLTPGRGLRRAAFDEMARGGTPSGWAVAATVSRYGVETRIGTGTAGEGTESRKVRINGAPSKPEALLEYLRLLWLTPAMDGLFTGPASDRRRFLDRLVLTVDPGHARRTRDFDKLLTQRNRLLEDNAASAWLDAVEAELAATAVAVALARAETVALLSVRLAAQADDASGFPPCRIALAGEFDIGIGGFSATEAELAYRRSLAAGRAADRAAGRTLEGPHRTDLDVMFARKNMPAALSSTGEQKALLIGILLAHAEIVSGVSGMTPVLLLDEVAAHLDASRRSALFARLASLGCQVFMTGADEALFKGMSEGTAIFHVGDDRIVRPPPPSGK